MTDKSYDPTICIWCKGKGKYIDSWDGGFEVWCDTCKGTGKVITYQHYPNGDEIGGQVNPARFPGPCEVWFLRWDKIARGKLVGYSPASECAYEQLWRVHDPDRPTSLPFWPPSEAITAAEDWRTDAEFCAAIGRMCREVVDGVPEKERAPQVPYEISRRVDFSVMGAQKLLDQLEEENLLPKAPTEQPDDWAEDFQESK